MRRHSLIALALLALGWNAPGAATPARAAVPGINLTWDDCSGFSAGGAVRSFACDRNDVGFDLVASFAAGRDIADFVGITADIGIEFFSAGGVPDWWQVSAGGCREGALGLRSPQALTGCANPYAGAAASGLLWFLPPVSCQGRHRIALEMACWPTRAVQGSTRYTGAILRLDAARTVDEGDGACSGCVIPACLMLLRMELFSLLGGMVASIEQPDWRDWAEWQPTYGNCPTRCTEARTSTWGRIKATYR